MLARRQLFCGREKLFKKLASEFTDKKNIFGSNANVKLGMPLLGAIKSTFCLTCIFLLD
jgi:hypothetical protein